MPVQIRIPTPLRKLTHDEEVVETNEEEESFTAPQVSASARDPEDDKWTSFPDISFPGSK